MRKAEMARDFWRSASGLPVAGYQRRSSSRTMARTATMLKAMMEAAAISSWEGKEFLGDSSADRGARRLIQAAAAKMARLKRAVAKWALKKSGAGWWVISKPSQ